jgi:hypothetical protein
MKEVDESNKPASKYSEIGMVPSNGSNQATHGSSSGSESNKAANPSSSQAPTEAGMISSWQKFENQYIKPTFTKERKDPYSYEVEQPLGVAAQNAQL